MTEDIPHDDEVADDEIPIVSEEDETYEVSEEGEVEQIVDPLQEAIQRAEKAEKEIAYKEAETQNVRKRMLTEKSDAIKYGGMGMARRMLTILADVDRALTGISDDDESAVAQGLRLLRNKMWRELEADGVKAIESKGKMFDPSKMEAITTIPTSENFAAGQVVDVLESGFMYKDRIITVARVVVASECSSLSKQ